MRRLFPLSLLLVALLAVAQPAGAAWTVEEEMLALADWSVPTEKRDVFRWYFALVMRNDEVQGRSVRAAFMGKGRCIRERKKENGNRTVSVMCMGRGSVQGDPDESFEMHSAMESAHLELTKKGRTHTADWVATKPSPYLYSSMEMCSDGQEEGEGYGGGIGRQTEATARMFGKHLRPRSWWDFSLLAKGAMVTECAGYHGYEVSELNRLEPGDVFHISRQFTITR